MAKDGLRRAMHRLIGAGLPVPAPMIRLYELITATFSGAEKVPDLPPPALRMRVAGSPDARVFTHGGELAVETLRTAVAAAGRDLAGFATILDFGCGCGRVLRLLRNLHQTCRIGVDVDSSAIEWCAAHFPGDRFLVAERTGTLPLEPATVSLAYAFSVFTHLDVTLQQFWLAEMHRLLEPGGVFVCSTHGVACRGLLSDREKARFDSDEIVVRLPNANTSNLCNSFHPPRAFRDQISGLFQVIAFTEQGARGNAPQDLWVLRK